VAHLIQLPVDVIGFHARTRPLTVWEARHACRRASRGTSEALAAFLIGGVRHGPPCQKRGKTMIIRPLPISRARVLEAIALIAFAAIVVAFVHSAVPYFAD
jgi:hypothetical protein